MCELVKWLSDSMWAKSLARTLLAFRLERERFHEIKAWPTIYRIPPSLHKYYIRRSKLKARGSPPPNTIVLFSGLDPWFSNEKGPLVSRQCSRSLFRTPLATEHGTEMDQYSVVKWGPLLSPGSSFVTESRTSWAVWPKISCSTCSQKRHRNERRTPLFLQKRIFSRHFICYLEGKIKGEITAKGVLKNGRSRRE